jgi:hypothetical protein
VLLQVLAAKDHGGLGLTGYDTYARLFYPRHPLSSEFL